MRPGRPASFPRDTLTEGHGGVRQSQRVGDHRTCRNGCARWGSWPEILGDLHDHAGSRAGPGGCRGTAARRVPGCWRPLRKPEEPVRATAGNSASRSPDGSHRVLCVRRVLGSGVDEGESGSFPGHFGVRGVRGVRSRGGGAAAVAVFRRSGFRRSCGAFGVRGFPQASSGERRGPAAPGVTGAAGPRCVRVRAAIAAPAAFGQLAPAGGLPVSWARAFLETASSSGLRRSVRCW